MPDDRPISVSLAMRQRLVVVLRADHARDRAEDLLARDPHALVRSVNSAGAR
jgi:hypothetical protein